MSIRIPERAEYLVIGTGPSGTAAINALIKLGICPLVIDTGGTISRNNYKNLKGKIRKNPGQKSWLGSYETYHQRLNSIEYGNEVESRISYLKGGFSRVWGGTFSFYKSFEGWPKSAIPTSTDLQSIKALVPHTHTSLFDEFGIPMEISTARLMEKIQSNCLSSDKWTLVNSVVAIDEGPSDNACVACGLCLSGCEFESIWYAGNQIDEWASSGKITYIAGLTAVSISNQGSQARVELVDSGNLRYEILSDQTFIGIGALATPALLVASGIFEKLEVKDTSTAFSAIINFGRTPKPKNNSHGLSQFWASDNQQRLLCQIYPPSPLHTQRIISSYPILKFFKPLIDKLMIRVHPMISYLSTDHSASITVSKSNNGVLVTAKNTRPSTQFHKKLISEFGKTLQFSSYKISTLLTTIPNPGSGYHHGSSIPHGLLSDDLGQIPFLPNVHFIDSSVLPTLELGSITPTVMANANRIVRQTIKK